MTMNAPVTLSLTMILSLILTMAMTLPLTMILTVTLTVILILTMSLLVTNTFAFDRRTLPSFQNAKAFDCISLYVPIVW